jgi:hypothetical protein
LRNVTPEPEPAESAPEKPMFTEAEIRASMAATPELPPEFMRDGGPMTSDVFASFVFALSEAHAQGFRELPIEMRGPNGELITSMTADATTLAEAAKMVETVRAQAAADAPAIDKNSFRTTPGLLAGPRPLQTQHGLARVVQAFADKDFKPNRDGDAFIHRVTYKDGKTDPIDVFIAPISSHFFPKDNPSVRFVPPPTLHDLLQKLERIGAFGAFTFAVVISLAVQWDRPQINLDDLIKELGLDPRSRSEREEYRALLWESLQLFAQTLVVGEVKGAYKDRKGNPISHIEKSPVIAITGTEYSSEMRLDGSETPAAVEYTLGSFYYRHRGNKQFLSYIGDLRQLAGIPFGKAAGQWARSIGLALFQHWREHAHEAEIRSVGNDSHSIARFKRIPTRRELFQRVKPDPDPFEILDGTSPKRARSYWDAALRILVDEKIAVLVEGNATSAGSRQDWQDAWLDEPVDIRPHFKGNAITVDGVRDIAAAQRARRRKRKKTPSSEQATRKKGK